MMKKFVFAVILFTLLLAPLSKLHAQSNNITATQDLSFNNSSVPQWARDLRRYEIVAIGTFPFTILFTTIFYDIYLRYNTIGLTGNYYENVLLISAGASLSLAFVDFIITAAKRNRERRRLESVSTGTYEIERLPYGEPALEEPLPGESPPN